MRSLKDDEYINTIEGGVHQALQILARYSGFHHQEPYISQSSGGDAQEWEIVEPWYHERDSGGDISGVHLYKLDAAIAEELLGAGFVKPLQVPEWGRTVVHEDKLVISRAGRTEVETFVQSMITKASGMLEPGRHTDLTGVAECYGVFRDNGNFGDLYVYFKSPSGYLKVYPDSGIVRPVA